MYRDFEFSLIQFVGDPVRREAINVGIVVLSPGTGQSRVRWDRSAMARVAAVWPGASARLMMSLGRDLRHRLADVHQPYFEEAGDSPVASREVLAELSNSLANQFHLTEPTHYRATSLSEATDELFARMVVLVPAKGRRGRYMTRYALRNMISGIVGMWASARGGVQLEHAAEVKGSVATHTVDVVTYEHGEPRMFFFATPTAGTHASLIRDALPTVVADIRAVHEEGEFFAVLGDGAPSEPRDKDAVQIARTMLSRVSGLEVVEVEELRERFTTQKAAL